MINRYEAVGIALMSLALAMGAPRAAKAEALTLRIINQPATLSGLPPAPVPTEFYRSNGATGAVAPSAAIRELFAPAPTNGCRVPAFEVVSGPKDQRGCYGAR